MPECWDLLISVGIDATWIFRGVFACQISVRGEAGALGRTVDPSSSEEEESFSVYSTSHQDSSLELYAFFSSGTVLCEGPATQECESG